MIKVLFICHGNICRSTMAESVMTYLVEKEGLADRFYINSAATSREEIGNGVNHGTVAKLNMITLVEWILRISAICRGYRAEIRMRRYISCLLLREADLMWQTHGIREILRQLTGMFWQAAKDCLNVLRKNCRRLQAGYMSKCHGNICE